MKSVATDKLFALVSLYLAGGYLTSILTFDLELTTVTGA